MLLDRSPENLRDKATRITDTAASKDWLPLLRRGARKEAYLWKSDHELLYCVKNTEESGPNDPRALAVLDTRTGKTRLIRAKSENVTLTAEEWGVSVSPDGQQLLGWGMKSGSGPFYLFTLALDGSGKRSTWLIYSDEQHNFWEADSQSWVRFTPPIFGKAWRAWRYRLDRPGAEPELIAGAAFPGRQGISPLGAFGPGVYLGYETIPGASRILTVVLPGKGALPPPTVKAPLLKGQPAQDIPVPSPQGDRVLWCEARQPPPSPLASVRYFAYSRIPVLQHILPGGMNTFPTPIYEVWVSRADGSNPQFLGVLPAVVHINQSPIVSGYGSGGMGVSLSYASFTSPVWLPGGKQIAFWQDGALYVAPVPAP